MEPDSAKRCLACNGIGLRLHVDAFGIRSRPVHAFDKCDACNGTGRRLTQKITAHPKGTPNR